MSPRGSNADESIHQLQSRLHSALEGLKRHLSTDVGSPAASPTHAHAESRSDLRRRLQDVHRALEHAKTREETYLQEISSLKMDVESSKASARRKQHAMDLLQKSIDTEVERAHAQVRQAVTSRTDELAGKVAHLEADLATSRRIHKETLHQKESRIAELESTVEMLSRAGKRQAEELVQKDNQIAELTYRYNPYRVVGMRSVSGSRRPSLPGSPAPMPSISRLSSGSLAVPVTQLNWPEVDISASMGKQKMVDVLRPESAGLPLRYPHPTPMFTQQDIGNINLINTDIPASMAGYLYQHKY